MLEVLVRGKGLERFEEAVTILGDRPTAYRAYARALNNTGRKGFTKVKRSLAKQVGLTQKKTVEFGAVKMKRADTKRGGHTQALAVAVVSKGDTIPLKEFSAKQFGYGVRAKPWGKSRRFDGTFIFAGTPGSGKFVAGGNVFRRTSGASTPIKKMYGPAVPKEMVKDQSADAWEGAAEALPARIAHEISVITRGVVR